MKRSDPRRGASLATVPGSIALLSALRVMRHARLPAAIFVFLLSSAAEPGAVAIAQAQDRPAAAPSNPVAAQSLEQLSTIVDRPLFSPSCRPPAPPPAPPPIVQAAEPPAPPPPPPNLVLFGVVMDGESARAVVRSGADKKLVRAQIGDEIDGWKVSQIEGRKVVLSLDGRFATFTLFSDDRGKVGILPEDQRQLANRKIRNDRCRHSKIRRRSPHHNPFSRKSVDGLESKLRPYCSDILSHTRRNSSAVSKMALALPHILLRTP